MMTSNEDIDEYIVQNDDSLMGISMKLDIKLYTLLRLNSLSEDSLIWPGMKLKIKKKADEEPQAKKTIIKSFEKEVIYCTNQGEVSGKLFVGPEIISFFPHEKIDSICEVRQFNSVKRSETEKFKVTIDYQNINDISILDNCELKPREHVIILQITVNCVGKNEVSDAPIAILYFKVNSS